jgi:hypothetical protein
MRMALVSWCLILAALLAGCEATVYPEPSTVALDEAAAAPYDFPFIDPYVATVVGTPPGYQAPLPAAVPRRELEITVLPGRPAPPVLWYEDSLRATLVQQEGEAPLVFIIAGTGAGHDAQNVKIMEKAFYQAGFHVISLPSPTHPNFVVTASTSGVPGRIKEDAPDLYRAMRLAYEEVAGDIEVSSFHLTGYSLGGWQAAFVAHLDESERAFGFEKILASTAPCGFWTTCWRTTSPAASTKASTASSTRPSRPSTTSTSAASSSVSPTISSIAPGWTANRRTRICGRSSASRFASRRPT